MPGVLAHIVLFTSFNTIPQILVL